MADPDAPADETFEAFIEPPPPPPAKNLVPSKASPALAGPVDPFLPE